MLLPHEFYVMIWYEKINSSPTDILNMRLISLMPLPHDFYSILISHLKCHDCTKINNKKLKKFIFEEGKMQFESTD